MNELKYHKRMVSRKSHLPILQHVMVSDGRMYSTDLDMVVSTETDMADGLYRLVGKEWVPAAKSSGFTVEDFPAVRPVLPKKDYGSVTIPKPSDRDIKRLETSASVNETREALMSVAFDFSDKGVTLVSTDGRRLAMCSVPLEEVPKGLLGVHAAAMNRRDTRNILRQLVRDKQATHWRITAHKRKNEAGSAVIRIESHEVTIDVRYTDGAFPLWRNVVPDPQRMEEIWVFSTKEMEKACTQLIAITTGMLPPVITLTASPEKDAVILTGLNEEEELCRKEAISAEVTGQGDEGPVRIAVNPLLLKDALLHDGERTRLMLQDAYSQMLVQASEAKKGLQGTVLMPIRQ